MKNKLLLQTKLNLEYYFTYLIYKLMSVLPISLVSYLGGSIFKLVGPLTKTQNIVKKNYLQIAPGATKVEILKQTKLSWFNTGRTFFELLILPKIISINNKIIIEGLSYIDQVKKNKEQVIFIGIHESNWEILLPTIDKIGLPVGGIYRHINNPYINKLILKLRNNCISSQKSFYTPKGQQSAKEVINAIKNNLSIVLLIDQKDSAGEEIIFFNKLIKTQTGFLKIARKYKIPIVPMENKRLENGKFLINFHKPFYNNEIEISDKDMMIKIHKIIEKWILENPQQWLWQHNRFN